MSCCFFHSMVSSWRKRCTRPTEDLSGGRNDTGRGGSTKWAQGKSTRHEVKKTLKKKKKKQKRKTRNQKNEKGSDGGLDGHHAI
eukprot:1079081-Amphidinium_carterae.1